MKRSFPAIICLLLTACATNRPMTEKDLSAELFVARIPKTSSETESLYVTYLLNIGEIHIRVGNGNTLVFQRHLGQVESFRNVLRRYADPSSSVEAIHSDIEASIILKGSRCTTLITTSSKHDSTHGDHLVISVSSAMRFGQSIKVEETHDLDINQARRLLEVLSTSNLAAVEKVYEKHTRKTRVSLFLQSLGNSIKQNIRMTAPAH